MNIHGIGTIPADSGMKPIKVGGGGRFTVGRDGVQAIFLTGDRKVEFISWPEHTLAYVRSAMGYPALYPLEPARLQPPIRALLMDLDGTSVRSEPFWMWIIEQTVARLMDRKSFHLEEADAPHVSGHSVSEHIQYCISKYCADLKVEDGRRIYFEITARELKAILEGGGRADAFVPAPHLKEFLLEIKARGIRVALVTGGLYEKAWPEIVAAFRTLGMGAPLDYYEAIIHAGSAVRPGQAGTLGELETKPHPWPYAEAARLGLGIKPDERAHCFGIEDSGAGVCSVRLAGFAAVGIRDGNITRAGVEPLLHSLREHLLEVLELVR